jgi:hypothetical protein
MLKPVVISLRSLHSIVFIASIIVCDTRAVALFIYECIARAVALIWMRLTTRCWHWQSAEILMRRAPNGNISAACGASILHVHICIVGHDT